jgi:hypothetical protein
MPDITVYMNCDTRLAINLKIFDLSEYDEFIFAIKNYSYIDSPYVFLFRARKEDIDENGEVIFKITPEDSKKILPGAFYNFSVLINAFNKRAETEYKKLTENGNIIIEYGAHDLALPVEEQPIAADTLRVTGIKLVDPETVVEDVPDVVAQISEVIG